jgi:hypothetical protein
MQKYYSRLLVLERDQDEGIFCKGRGWQIAFESNHLSCILAGPNREPAKEIVIYTGSMERAQYVVDLVFAAYCLSSGELLADEPNRVFEKRPETQREVQRQIMAGGHDLGVSYLPVACLIAAKASQKVGYQNALFKFLLSNRVVPLSVDALDPERDWEPSRAVTSSPEQHVFDAEAIVLGYSVLEELSLEVRASYKVPSRVEGRWNPIVKKELEDRLLKNKIDLSEHILWHLRDTPTRIERSRRPDTKRKCEWAAAKVRDVYLEVIDAIAYASWLRSGISAHRLSPLAKSLTVYDVANVQHLARRLLLESLGFWRYYQRHPEILKLYEGDKT